MMVRILLLSFIPILSFAQSNSKVAAPVNSETNVKGPLELKRNTFYNLDEIKVRWKKAALENCPWVVCPTSTVPDPCSSIVATPTGPSSASVSFVPPANDGGSPITGYILTATPTSSAPAKRKSSSVIVITGTSSPILVTGLSFGVNYIFSVLATNAIGGSPPITTTTTVTPCILNTALAASTNPTLNANTALTNVTIATTGATGIGTVSGLPAGVTANWASNRITISGTPTVSGTFSYSILLTGGCGSVNATGTITVTDANTVSAASSTPTLCISTALTNITHTTIGATGIGAATGLPTGVSATFANNTITISGTPSATGTFGYSIPLTGGFGSVSATGTITVTAANTATAASSTPTLCISTALTPSITHTTTEATGIGAATGLPAGVTAAWASNTITISGTPTATGTFNYSIPLTGGCGSVSATGTITVTAANTSTAASITPTLCISTALTTSITHTTTGATGISNAGVSGSNGLPAGVSASWAGSTITISGTPTAAGIFVYSIPLTGGCGSVSATGTITVTATNTATAASITPTLCNSTALTTSITHTTTGATGISNAGVSGSNGLPAGVSASWAGSTITISGTPTASGTFNYSILLSGGCGSVSATGTITVTAANTATAASSTPTLCISTALTPSITHTTTEATGIGAATGLPAGVTAAWASNTITISGTPTATGTFNYSIPLTGGCGSVSATGTITVTAANTVTAASSTPTLCINTALTPSITHTTIGATGIGAATGLPAGVTAAWASNMITISGTPTAAGIFVYSIPLTGGCGSVSATGTITVTAANTATAASITPTLCISTALTTSITHTTIGATGIGAATGLPTGVSASWAGSTITISGTPTAAGIFVYSIPLTGGCGSVSATGTITVTANTATAASITPTLCISTALTTSITHTTTGATGISNDAVSGSNGLPAGVSASWAGSTITISGTPTATGTFNYSIPLTGGCGSVNATGTITVTAANTVTAASSNPTLCISTALTDITHTTTEATGISNAGASGSNGLPAGVSASWAGSTITISGTPTASGTFNYSIPLTGGCGSVSATGTITVTAANIAGAASSNPTLVVNTALTNVMIVTTGATGISNDAVSAASGLPAGVSATWASNTITISGTPSASGIFTYSIPLTGGCGTVNATGTITVCSVLNTAGTPLTSPTIVVNSGLTPITIATTGATGISNAGVSGASGLPDGVSATFASNTITISGTPSVTGPFNYSIPLTGGCGTVNATGTMTVIPACPIGKDTIRDIDNNSYNIVAIGTQCWTKENLRVRKYNDGTSIVFDNYGGTLGVAGNQDTWENWTVGAHTINGNDSTSTTGSLAIYGYLYNWYAARGVASPNSTTYKNICPSGWRVPTDSEWKTLTTFLGGITEAGRRMKSTSSRWTTFANTAGNDESGFSALPGGFRRTDGEFANVGTQAFFWSNTIVDKPRRGLFHNGNNVKEEVGDGGEKYGFSIRCLKD